MKQTNHTRKVSGDGRTEKQRNKCWGGWPCVLSCLLCGNNCFSQLHFRNHKSFCRLWTICSSKTVFTTWSECHSANLTITFYPTYGAYRVTQTKKNQLFWIYIIQILNQQYPIYCCPSYWVAIKNVANFIRVLRASIMHCSTKFCSCYARKLKICNNEITVSYVAILHLDKIISNRLN